MNLSLAVIAIFALNVLTPGASFVLTMQTTLAQGRSAGNHVAFGLALCDFIYACVAALGIASLLQHYSALGHAIALLGGGWLAFIGGKIFFRKGEPKVSEEGAWPASTTLSRPFRLGLTAGALNPQATVFFTTIFVGPVLAKPSDAELVLLVMAIGAVSILVRAGMVRLFTTRNFQYAYWSRQRLMTRVAGAILMVFSFKLLTPPALLLLTLIFT